MTLVSRIILTIEHDDHVDRAQAEADARALATHLREPGNDPCADVPIDALVDNATVADTEQA